MTIALTACRLEKKDTVVTISFSDTKKDTFKYVDKHLITNSNGEEGVIFHIKNDDGTEMETSGSGNLLFSENFTVTTNEIRVFYWNDSGLLVENLECFREFLEEHGLRDVPSEVFICPLSEDKTKTIPRQAGNGGVVRIVDRP